MLSIFVRLCLHTPHPRYTMFEAYVNLEHCPRTQYLWPCPDVWSSLTAGTTWHCLMTCSPTLDRVTHVKWSQSIVKLFTSWFNSFSGAGDVFFRLPPIILEPTLQVHPGSLTLSGAVLIRLWNNCVSWYSFPKVFSLATSVPFMVVYVAPMEIASLGREMCSSEEAVASCDLILGLPSHLVHVVQGSVMTVLVTSKICPD